MRVCLVYILLCVCVLSTSSPVSIHYMNIVSDKLTALYPPLVRRTASAADSFLCDATAHEVSQRDQKCPWLTCAQKHTNITQSHNFKVSPKCLQITQSIYLHACSECQ